MNAACFALFATLVCAVRGDSILSEVLKGASQAIAESLGSVWVPEGECQPYHNVEVSADTAYKKVAVITEMHSGNRKYIGLAQSASALTSGQSRLRFLTNDGTADAAELLKSVQIGQPTVGDFVFVPELKDTKVSKPSVVQNDAPADQPPLTAPTGSFNNSNFIWLYLGETIDFSPLPKVLFEARCFW